MGSQVGRPGLGSALGRAVLLAPAVFLLIGLPENVDSWDSPNASVLPSERTMPVWGNSVLAIVTVAAMALLVAGWVQRRSAGTEASRVQAAVTWATLVGLAAWSVALLASQVIRLFPDDGVTGQGFGIYIDGVFAVAALATAAVVIRDAFALRRAQ
ncbi:hypothetical protein [Demequina aestuarii]|uniref:hypothetical protein n=1 Tax=Demequina aestuarii TaxID=327095 RepID=UPI0007836787|nr:hypothetical protein [Demequina aestuarii]